MSKKETNCSFCGRPRNEVGMLIAGVSGHICESCATQAHTIVQEENVQTEKTEHVVNAFKPIEIKEKLDDYVIGQEDAKKDFDDAIEKDPKDATIYFNRGNVFLNWQQD